MSSDFRPYRRLIRPVLPHIVVAVVLGVIFSAASGFGIPFTITKILPVLFPDNGVRGDLEMLKFPPGFGWEELTGDQTRWKAWAVPAGDVLHFALLLLPGTFLIRALSGFGKDYLMNHAGMHALESLRILVFTRLQKLPLDFFRKIPAGDISQRMSSDTALVRYALTDIIGDLVTQPLTLLFAFGFVVVKSCAVPGLGQFVVSLAIVPLTVLPIRFVGKKLQRRAHQMLTEGGLMNAMLVESIQAPREIRAYNLQDREIARYSKRSALFLRFQMKLVKYEKMLPPAIEFLATVSITLAIWRVTSISGTHIKSTDIVGLVGALYLCYDPVKRLGGVSARLKQAGAALGRLEEILNAPVDIADPAAPAEFPPARGEIEFDGVAFAYPGNVDAPVFKNLSARIMPGEIVALVGPSGSGKSTFANLVPRFYDATGGRVLVDGVDVRAVTQRALRERIAVVSQEPILFSDTVAANLRLGKPDATDAELREAARKAGALDFINALPAGFETGVGERGGSLSGGQRQRLAIARAFLKNAPILILDEATSALDAETEAQIQSSLEELVRGKTVLIIAHRFSTIRFATRILVFDQTATGLTADGDHATLVTTSPLYRGLWERQKFGGE